MTGAQDLAAFDVFLFDIEGTVCPISFVKDTLFPYALQSLPETLESQWDAPEFAPYRQAFPEEYRNSKSALEAHVRDLTERDVKAPYLKALQGLLWQRGYDAGELKAPLFSDVAPFFQQIHAAGKKIMIYSSGSVSAQKLLFGHTNTEPNGDLRSLISDWFDTVNAGPKTEVSSYLTIQKQHIGVTRDPARWLFFSDNMLEVEAALKSGMRSFPVTRPGNHAFPEGHRLAKCAISDFTSLSAKQAEEVAAKFQ